MHICNITRTKKQHIYSQEGYTFRRDLTHLKQLKEISIIIKNGEKISEKEQKILNSLEIMHKALETQIAIRIFDSGKFF